MAQVFCPRSDHFGTQETPGAPLGVDAKQSLVLQHDATSTLVGERHFADRRIAVREARERGADHPIDVELMQYIQSNKINNELFSLLMKNSTDPVFLGYPYGLIEADKSARVSNKESEYLKTIFLVKAGKQLKKISQYFKSTDAHSILDKIGDMK